MNRFIARFSASDADEPNSENSKIRYSLGAYGSEMFSIHSKTGNIRFFRLSCTIEKKRK